jgi:hypothetical protein
MNPLSVIIDFFGFFRTQKTSELQDLGIILQKKLSLTVYFKVEFQVLMASSMIMAVFWIVAPCSWVEVHRCFRGAVGKLLPDYTAQQPRRQPS